MNTRKTKAPKRAAAPKRKKPEPFEILEAGTTEEMMALNGPKVLAWALRTTQKAARGRATMFEQKIALLMLNKFTPSSGKRKAEDGEDLPEGTTREEFLALNRLIEGEKRLLGGSAPTPAAPAGAGMRESTGYQPKGQDEA